MEADLPEGLPKLVGIFDLVRTGGRIVDFKTSAQTPDAEKVEHIHETQLSCYAVLYRDATGKRESGVELHHLVKSKKPKVVITALRPMTETAAGPALPFHGIVSGRIGPAGLCVLARDSLFLLRVLQRVPFMERKGGGRMTLWKCRLTLIDFKGAASVFARSPKWITILGVCHVEWLELSAERHACQFDTERPPVAQLRKVSRLWARLTLLLDYEEEWHRIKGVAKAKAGQIEHCEISY